MGPPPGRFWASRAILVRYASTLSTGSLVPPPVDCAAAGLWCVGVVFDCVEATVTTCCCSSATAAVGGGCGSCCGGCCGGGGGCCVVCWWNRPARLRCMNALWSSSAVFCPAGSVVVVLVEGKLVCAGLSVVVVVVVVGGFLLPPPMVLPSRTAANGSGLGGGGCCCCGRGSEAVVLGPWGWFPLRGRPSSSGCLSGCAPGLV